MAGRISWSLNLPPLINKNSPVKTTSQIPCPSKRRREKENRSQLVAERRRSKSYLLLRIAASGVILALQMSDVASVESVVMDLESPVKEERRRWSDKRMCPSWLQNSFETIVPENLPRPSGHRRWELAGLAMGEGDAPPLGAVVTRADRTGCFSM